MHSRYEQAENPFVSVIVPCYNLARCVDRCVQSLLVQSYANYEIVLVDDGSTDETRAVLSKYEGRPHIVVLTKPNGGLSDARNFGVRHALGDYVTFVDGDDIVSPFYLKSLVSGIVKGKRTLVASHFLVVPEADITSSLPWKSPTPARIIGKSHFGKQLLYETITESAWGKLAPRQVYLDHPFPVGKVYEDLATVMQFVDACNAFSLVDEAIYGYVMRPGSIVNNKRMVEKNGQDYLDALAVFTLEAKAAFPREENGIAFRRALTASRLHALVGEGRTAEARRIDAVAMSILRDNLGRVLKDPAVPKSSKARFRLMDRAPQAYLKTLHAYEKLVKKL